MDTLARLFCLLFLVGSAAASAKLSANSAKVDPPSVLTREQREMVDTRALEVRDGDQTVMRVWFRKAIPVQAPPGREATYRNIAEGTIVGVLELPRVFVEYRRQRLSAGVYALRYAVQPDTGEHTDTSPHREFLLLTRVEEDRGAERMEAKRLIELSRKINEGTHPALLLLWPITDRDTTGSIIDEGKGVMAVAVRRTGDAGGRKRPIGFGITVAGSRKP